MPEVSYLIPSYNHANYLVQLLNSIKEDALLLNKPLEVIIIDDGSSDISVEVIHEWIEANKEQLHVCFLTQANQGISNVLNKLIALAQGTYLRLCASDDKIVPGSTAWLLDKLLSQPDLCCVVGDGQIINEHNEIIHLSSIAYHGGNIHRLKKANQLVKELIQHWCLAGPSILIKKSHYVECLRYNEDSTIDDFELFLSLLKIPNSIAFIDQIVCQYRLHQTNTSKTKDVARRLKNLYSFQGIIDKNVLGHPGSKYLIPLRYKNLAKINYLENNYLHCFLNLGLSFFYTMKR